MVRRVFLVVFLIGIAAGTAGRAQDNMRGAPYNGYTGQPFDTTHYAYDYLVDSSLPQDDPAQKKFKTLQAAYAAAPSGTPDHPLSSASSPTSTFCAAARLKLA